MARKSNRSHRSTRIKACELAAHVMAGIAAGHPDYPNAPRLWSLAVFFECYIDQGANGTMKDFGPKKPRKLKVVSK